MSDNHKHPPMGDINSHRMTLTLTLEDEGQDPFAATADALKVIAAMVKGGVVHADNQSVTTGAHFHYAFAPGFGQGMYLDGEGLMVAVDEDGDIFDVIRQDGTSDGSLDMLPMLDPMAWAAAHGGLWDVDSPETAERLSPAQSKFLKDLDKHIGHP